MSNYRTLPKILLLTYLLSYENIKSVEKNKIKSSNHSKKSSETLIWIISLFFSIILIILYLQNQQDIRQQAAHKATTKIAVISACKSQGGQCKPAGACIPGAE